METGLLIDELTVADWQLNHIKESLQQAEAGEFASEAEIKAVFDVWKKKC